MKITKVLSTIAIGSLSISPIMTTAAYATTTEVPVADGANANTLATMQTQCSALALAHGTNWSAVAVEGDATLNSGPTELPPRTIDPLSVVGTGAFTWGGIAIVGDPFRNGGSVNMFGNQRATEQNFASSEYDYTADFSSTFAYASTCDMTETIHHDAVPGRPAEGFYVNNGTNPSGGGGSCAGLSPANPHWGTDIGNCIWNETAPAVDPVDAYDEVNYSTEFGAPVLQDQTDNFQGHEVNGGPVTLAGDLFVGNPVVCISPKKLPGIWTKQNGYTGDKCTTVWFNDPSIARNGSTTSQGTYISVPAY